MTTPARSGRATRASQQVEPRAPRTALDELVAEGRLGPLGARHLYRVVRAVVVAHGFPPPAGRRSWDSDGLTEVAHDFLADARTPARLGHLAVHAVDEASFDRLLHRMVLNHLRDGGRRTEIGRLMLRLRDVLGRSDTFAAEPGDRWRLASEPSRPSRASLATLADAAAAEAHIDVPRWSPQTRRRPPVADAASLQRLCQRVLEVAAGTVALDDLARSIAPRLGLSPTPLAQALDDHARLDAVEAPQYADSALDGMRAAEILAILSQRERLLLAATGTPVRDLRAVIGLGPSRAAELQGRLRAVLAMELRDDDRYESVFFHLVDQAKAWAASRATGHPGALPRLEQAT
jgi:hypothetical protein